MKNSRKYRHLRVVHPQQPIFPNAADHNYFAQKALDAVTALVSVIGFTSAMLFLVTMA